MGGRLETIVESDKAKLFEAMLCVCECVCKVVVLS